MYYTNPLILNGLKFTPREVDVIACVVHARGGKKIASILGISHRTVEGYIHDIRLKIRTNSQEGIRDFVESTPEINSLRWHYMNLQLLNSISSKLKSKNISCVVKYEGNTRLKNIAGFLRKVGIRIINESQGEYSSEVYTILELTQKSPQGTTKFKAIYFCFDATKLNALNDSKNITIIDCSGDDLIYEAIFKTLAILAPDIVSDDVLSKMTQTKNEFVSSRHFA